MPSFGWSQEKSSVVKPDTGGAQSVRPEGVRVFWALLLLGLAKGGKGQRQLSVISFQLGGFPPFRPPTPTTKTCRWGPR